MKKIFFTSVLLIFTLVSCNKKETIYSCNPTVNEWTIKHSNSFHGITRGQIATLAPTLQKAVYRTLTAEEKHELWKEKLFIVRNSEIPEANENLISEIDILLNKIQSNWYDRDGNESLKNEDSTFLSDWEKRVLSTGGIDSTSYIINFCTLMTKDEIDLLLYKPEEVDHTWITKFDLPDVSLNLKAAPQDCSCRYNIYCNIFLSDECKTGGCTQVHDCGLAGSSACKGLCPEEIAPID